MKNITKFIFLLVSILSFGCKEKMACNEIPDAKEIEVTSLWFADRGSHLSLVATKDVEIIRIELNGGECKLSPENAKLFKKSVFINEGTSLSIDSPNCKDTGISIAEIETATKTYILELGDRY